MNAVEVLEEMQVFVGNLPFELKQILQEIQVLNSEIEKIEKLQRQNDVQIKRKIKALKVGEITGGGLTMATQTDADKEGPAKASESADQVKEGITDEQKESDALKPLLDPAMLLVFKKDSEELLKTEPALMALYQAIEVGYDQIQEKTALKLELVEKSKALMDRHYSRLSQELERIEEMELSGVAMPPVVSLSEPPPVRKATLTAMKKVTVDQPQSAVLKRTISQINGPNSRHSFPGQMVIPQSVKKQKRKIGDISVGDAVAGGAADEQLYCTCQQVSYGEMIACDNKSCPFEWFHLDCVQLQAPPTGVWFCEHCRVEKESAV